MSNIVQYVLLRSDLLKELGWSIGALVAQACHASTAVLHLYKDDEHTLQYMNDLDNMHKVVLEVPNEEALRKIETKLSENSIAYKLWIEQPENIPTCLALKPYPKEDVKKFVGKFKLYKATLKKTVEQMVITQSIANKNVTGQSRFKTTLDLAKLVRLMTDRRN
ncbi:unnamed protein product [Chilo suppressalis]|uniref:peptidyl-tRNA hydrolase n=1 Tax=Chilo suppressalis TaxID=168631 RepID=A0ABN8AVF8_CHISP|nr:unnamed protein product [Chilo suppressalis]